MSASDDPEERIRELERSLSDRTSEVTRSSTENAFDQNARGPSYPHPQWPPTLSPPASGGVGRTWLLLGLVAVVPVAIVAGAVVYFSNVFARVDSPFDGSTLEPTIHGGGGPFGESPGRSAIEIPRVPFDEPAVSSVPPGGDISVSGVGGNRTFECNDGVVNISGVDNDVVLTGHCASVTVSGIDNVVSVEAVDAINTSGFDNRVTYGAGVPDIQNAGDSNVVERG